MPKFDTPDIKALEVKPDKVYVTVPDEDMFEMIHPDIIINGTVYGPGKHYLDSVTAGTVAERVRLFAKSQVRLMQPKADRKALNDINRGSSNKVAGGTYADPNSPDFS